MFGLIAEEMLQKTYMFIGSMTYEDYITYYKNYNLNPSRDLWKLGRRYYLSKRVKIEEDMPVEEKMAIKRSREILGKMPFEEAKAYYEDLNSVFDEEYWIECRSEFLEEHPQLVFTGK